MYKIFLSITILFLLLITVIAGIKQPKMHKAVMIYNSDYSLVAEKPQNEPVKALPTQVIKPQVTPVTVETKTVTDTVKKVTTPQKTVKQEQKQTQPVQQTQTIQKVELPKSIKNIVSDNVEPVKTVVQQEEQTQQELILWNKWRSNLQNQIMNDTRLPIIPEGVVFKFSFEVDKYGKISNVHTWSLTPAYTPYAIQYIAPVIKSYQGRSILNFPTGSNRFSTVVDGGWKIAKVTKYSTPDDYRDTEKVNK